MKSVLIKDMKRQILDENRLPYDPQIAAAMNAVEQAILSNLYGQQEPIAWVHPDDPTRSITHHQKLGAIKDGGAIEKTMRVFSVPAYARPIPAIEQEPVAVVGSGFQLMYRGGAAISEIEGLKVGMMLYANPYVTPASDKPACVSENRGGDTQKSKRHNWDDAGERCLDCGDKDWFAGLKCSGKSSSPTKGMSLGERISHVGGRENKNGYIEFGSVMAVHALISHLIRDKCGNCQGILDSSNHIADASKMVDSDHIADMRKMVFDPEPKPKYEELIVKCEEPTTPPPRDTNNPARDKMK